MKTSSSIKKCFLVVFFALIINHNNLCALCLSQVAPDTSTSSSDGSDTSSSIDNTIRDPPVLIVDPKPCVAVDPIPIQGGGTTTTESGGTVTSSDGTVSSIAVGEPTKIGSTKPASTDDGGVVTILPYPLPGDGTGGTIDTPIDPLPIAECNEKGCSSPGSTGSGSSGSSGGSDGGFVDGGFVNPCIYPVLNTNESTTIAPSNDLNATRVEDSAAVLISLLAPAPAPTPSSAVCNSNQKAILMMMMMVVSAAAFVL